MLALDKIKEEMQSEERLLKKGSNFKGLNLYYKCFKEYIKYPSFKSFLEGTGEYTPIQQETINQLLSYKGSSPAQAKTDILSAIEYLSGEGFSYSWEDFETFYLKWTKKQKTQGINNNTVTSVTNVTYVTRIFDWGYININNKILIERIKGNYFFVNDDGNYSIVSHKIGNIERNKIYWEEKKSIDSNSELNSKEKNKKIKELEKSLKKNYPDYYYLSVGKDKKMFRFEGKPKQPPYTLVNKEYVEGILNTEIIEKDLSKEFNILFEELKNTISLMYDFRFKNDVIIVSLFISASWIVHLLNSSFYLGIDATRGAGKTTLLEIIKLLSRHGLLAGDVSTATIPRIKKHFDVTVLVDEIDEIGDIRGADLQGLMRRGQRRGNPYMRLNKNTLNLESFDAFGYYGYTFRKNVEDAFYSRTYPIHTAISKDKKLPIINNYKEFIVYKLHQKLFMWFGLHFHDLVTLVTKLHKLHDFDTQEKKITEIRSNLYEIILEGFTEEEKSVFNELFGRNIEIAYTGLLIAKILKLDLHKEIQEVLKQKQDNEEISDIYYFEKLKEFLAEKVEDLKSSDWKLTKGKFENCCYYPKTDLYTDFIQKLKEKSIITIGNSKFSSLLRDLGFVQDNNICNQKLPYKNQQVRCCIFNKPILQKLNVEPKPIITKENVYGDKDLIQFIKENPDKNAVLIEDKFGIDFVNKAKKEGLIFEQPAGTLKIL